MAAKKRKPGSGGGKSAETPKKRGPASPPAAKPIEDGAAPTALAEPDGHKPGRPGCPVVGIGASAGGLDAFKRFFSAMPGDSGIAFVLIPHLAPTHKSLMVELLAKYTPMPVLEAGEGMAVQPNHVYVIPPNKYLKIRDGDLRLSGPVPPASSQTSIDSFLRSLAEDQQERAVGIILSGTGSHGVLGLKAIKAAGGMVMVQDPETAEFDRMPHSAIASAAPDYVLAPQDMPAALLQFVRHAYINGGDPQEAERDAAEQLNQILALLRARTKYDFRSYRKKMPLRRVKRRMGLHHIDRLPEYLAFLREHPEELQQLASDLLISVTTFFRDPEAYHALQTHVLANLIQAKDADATLRVWVPGCATGEEAYSLAILLLEMLATSAKPCRLQVFATDVDEPALEAARQGIYPESIAADVSVERLARYFTRVDEHSYQVNKHLREAVTFAAQNVLSDAPFSKLDLISCRNLLIYLEPEVQNKVIALFHFALNEGGFLLLGPSETIGPHVGLFETAVKKWRIYRRIGPSRPEKVDIPVLPDGQRSGPFKRLPDSAAAGSTSLAELTRHLLLEDYAPAAVLIDRKHEILYFHGPTTAYLEQPSGEPTRDLLRLARDGLRTKLRAAIQQAVTQRQPVIIAAVRVKHAGGDRVARVTIKPVHAPKSADGLVLVIFENGQAPASAPPTTPDVAVDESLVSHLEGELDATRHELQSTIEEMETSNEQLKASNEEVMSVNEELQSSNEELETSKEELQSLNEELNTVNNQLREKVDELEQTNNDLANLLSSTDVATIFLDTRFCVERFTPASTKLFNLIGSDVGRPLSDIAPKFTDNALLEDCREVLRNLVPCEKEVQTNENRWSLRRILPYRTLDNKIEGVVITFVDVTLVKQAAVLRENRDRLAAIMDDAREGLVTIDEHGVIDSFNKTAEKLFGYRAEEIVGQNVNMLMPSPYREAHDGYLAKYLQTGIKKIIGNGRDVIARRKDGSTFPIALAVSELISEHGRLFTGLVRDISERKALEREIVDVAVEEQRRIGQDLHDSVGQELTGLGLVAESLAESMEKHDSPDRELAVRLSAGVKRIFAQTRSLSRGLVPLEVSSAHLADALTQLAAAVSSHSAVQCTFAGTAPAAWENNFAATHLYRIVQEAVTNALKHGRARHIRIHLETEGRHGTLQIADDGIGIHDETTSRQGIGLRIMRHRADLINAVLTIDAAKGGGTNVTCTFVMENRDEPREDVGR